LDGHLFCRECVFEFLLAQKQQMKTQKEAFDQQTLQEHVSDCHEAFS